MGRLFGTDGVRGIANKELTPELAFNLGKAGTFVLKKENARPVIVIGKDTRVSGDMLDNALTAGILAVGGNVIKAGIMGQMQALLSVLHIIRSSITELNFSIPKAISWMICWKKKSRILS